MKKIMPRQNALKQWTTIITLSVLCLQSNCRGNGDTLQKNTEVEKTKALEEHQQKPKDQNKQPRNEQEEKKRKPIEDEKRKNKKETKQNEELQNDTEKRSALSKETENVQRRDQKKEDRNSKDKLNLQKSKKRVDAKQIDQSTHRTPLLDPQDRLETHSQPLLDNTARTLPESNKSTNKTPQQHTTSDQKLPKQSTRMLYAKSVDEPAQLNDTPNVILIGPSGVGKTSLLNKLCGTNKKTAKGSSPLEEPTCISTNCGKHTFNIVDTPGLVLDKEESSPKKAVDSLYRALTARQYHGIIVVVRSQPKTYQITQEYKEIAKLCRAYQDNVLILICSSGEDEEDTDVDLQQYRGEVVKKFESKKIYNNIIFYSKHLECNRDDLADMIYGSISRMSPIKMEMSQKEFNENLNITEK